MPRLCASVVLTATRFARRESDDNAQLFRAVVPAFLVLRRPENLSSEDQRMLDLVRQAHPHMKVACELEQAFAQMIRARNASALEPWLGETLKSGVPELHAFAAGIKGDQVGVLAALAYD